MKKKIVSLNFLALICCSIALVGCKKEGCTDESASNYDEKAKKDDGSCIVDVVDSRDQIVGNYLITDSLFVGGTFSEEKIYVLQVNKGGTKKDTIYINNLWNEGGSLMAITAGSNFSVPNLSGTTGTGKVTGSTMTYVLESGTSEYRGKGSK